MLGDQVNHHLANRRNWNHTRKIFDPDVPVVNTSFPATVFASEGFCAHCLQARR